MTKPSVTSNAGRSSALDSQDVSSEAETLVGDDTDSSLTREERAFLDKIAESLARLGRVKRVGLGVKDKQDFIAMWTKTTKRR